MAPYRFNPRKTSVLDQQIAKIIDVYDIRIPIAFIKDNLYLIGPNRLNCDMKGDICMVRTGGGYQRFDQFVPFNHKNYEMMLASHVINTNKDLDWVVNQLIQGKKIKNDIFARSHRLDSIYQQKLGI